MFTMTKNVVRNLLSKSSTRLYPVEVRGNFDGYRGRLDNKIEDCIFCKSCQVKCPSQCITVDNKAGTWECDPYACVYCGVCVDHCPVHCLSMSKEHRKATAEKEMIFLQGTSKAKKKAAAAAVADASAPPVAPVAPVAQDAAVQSGAPSKDIEAPAPDATAPDATAARPGSAK